MLDRDDRISTFLRGTVWHDWERTALAGDASTRRYERLRSANDTVILMDAPPGTTRPFAKIANYLAGQALCPPQIHAHDPDLGLMIISDLGADDFAGWLIKHPHDSDELYRSATDVILHLQSCNPPSGLHIMSPQVGAEMVAITCDHYGGKPADDLTTEMEQALHRLAPIADTLALRDYHAENLIWRPDQSGFARIGLLDFQDAFIAPKGYDLMSLLRDARRDVAPDLVERVIADYLDRSSLGDSFRAQLACLGAQRNLRIIGVFARLARDMQKPRYLTLIPRVWHNLQADLQHPALHKLRQVVDATLPPPTDTHLQGLRS